MGEPKVFLLKFQYYIRAIWQSLPNIYELCMLGTVLCVGGGIFHKDTVVWVSKEHLRVSSN